MSRDDVSTCIASLCSAYRDGAQLVQQMKANDRSSRKTFQEAPIGTSAEELESSLNRGESAVRNQYERTHKHCGEAFAQGDRMLLSLIYLKLAEYDTEFARDALQENITHLQDQVIANLKRQWEQDTCVDFTALQDICDSIQDRAILVLMQLQQRTITLCPADPLPSSSISTVGRLYSPPPSAPQPSPHDISPVTVSPCSDNPSASGSLSKARKLPPSPSVAAITPPGTPFTSQSSLRSDSARGSRESTGTDGRDAPQYKPMATTVTTTGLFGIGRRTKVEPIVNPPENPLVDEYLAVAIEDAKTGLSSSASIRSRKNSISTSMSSICEPDHPVFNSWQDHQPSSPDPLQRPTASIISFDTSRHAQLQRCSGANKSNDSQRHASAVAVEILSSNRSINSISPKDLLPSEINNYAGFCKGAWRQQIGDRKRAMEERVRPGGMYNASKYYQCKQCKFEGHLVQMDKKHSGFDMRVFKLVQGIQFRWEFMFKSHVQVKDACSDPTKATFACIFCCAEGRGTPIFRGIQTFMNHLVVHREHLPTGEVLYRMNCLVGRQAAINDDFDINIISIERKDLMCETQVWC